MPLPDDILNEFKERSEDFESRWMLPWYAEGDDPVWGHPLLRIVERAPEEFLATVCTGLLEQRSFALRGIGARMVGTRRIEQLRDRLTELMAGDESVHVRALAAAALSDLALSNDELALDALLALPDAAHAEVKKAAIGGFRAAEDRRATPLLLRWLRDESQEDAVRIAAAGALGTIRDPDTAPALVQTLVDESATDGVRQAAAEALAELPPQPTIESSLRAASGDDARPWVRAAAIAALAQLGASDICEIIADAVRPENPWMVRSLATKALSRCPADAALPLLLKLAADEEARVREEACAALGRLADRRGLGVLRAALDDSELGIRINAARAIERVLDRDFGIDALIDAPQLDLARLRRILEDARAAAEA